MHLHMQTGDEQRGLHHSDQTDSLTLPVPSCLIAWLFHSNHSGFCRIAGSFSYEER